MTGVTGGSITGQRLRRVAEELDREPWYESERVEAGALGVAARHHGDRDPDGFASWSDGTAGGVVYGAITNLDELGWTHEDAFARLLRRPERTLRALEGQFLIAAVDGDDDRLLLATDKVGCRQCYFADGEEFVFGTSLAPIVEAVDDPEVDPQGVSDLIMMGYPWSDTTLLSGVSSLHPSTVLEYDDGEVTTTRYWTPSFSPARPTEQYFHELVEHFRGASDRLATTLSDDAGLWLSGGLDSRATMNELVRARRRRDDCSSVVAYTYDANPAGGGNPAIARQVARELESPHEEVPLTPDRFLKNLEAGVDSTDGMVRWNTFLNLSAINEVRPARTGVVMEGLEGALVGHHLTAHHFGGTDSLVESTYHSEATLPADRVAEMVAPEVDPLGSLRREARRSEMDTHAEAVVDAHFRNYYMRCAHASNQLPRRYVGTRIPYADGDFLEHVARLPLSYRMGVVPFTDGEIPFGVVRSKVRMIRALNDDLARIPYERSSLSPALPFPAHVVGFFASTALSQLRSRTTYGGRSMAGEWYRNHDGLRERIDGLIDDACDRPLFDADAVRDIQQSHLDRESEEISAIGAVTTAECWIQRHLD